MLELVDGETLADRIARGPLSTRDALAIGRQVADALDAAHEHGIVHRDLKPANIKVTLQGQVKVLDFGLAKLARESTVVPAAAVPEGRPQNVDPAVTRQGAILGTAAYMAPEQACGQPIDRRADVWAFGAVLYEMLTGRRAFSGEDLQQTLGAILNGVPDWSALPADLPDRIRRLLELCLNRDAGRRVRDMATVGLIMDGAFGDQRPTGRSVVGVGRWIGDRLARDRRRVERASRRTTPCLAFRAARGYPCTVQSVGAGHLSRWTAPRLHLGAEGSRTLSLHRMADPEGALATSSAAHRIRSFLRIRPGLTSRAAS